MIQTADRIESSAPHQYSDVSVLGPEGHGGTWTSSSMNHRRVRGHLEDSDVWSAARLPSSSVTVCPVGGAVRSTQAPSPQTLRTPSSEPVCSDQSHRSVGTTRRLGEVCSSPFYCREDVLCPEHEPELNFRMFSVQEVSPSLPHCHTMKVSLLIK